MAADNTLEILIKLGVIGKEDAAAVRDLIKETGETAQQSAKETNDSIPENLKGWGKYKEALHETGDESLSTQEKIHALHLAAHSLGPEFAGLGQMAKFLFNPLTASGALGVAGLEMVFKHAEKVQEKFRELVADGQKVNDIIREIVAARPTATQEWMEFNEQIAKLRGNFSNAKFVADEFINTMKGLDENKIRAAFDFQKPALERKSLTDEIANTQAALNRDQSRAGNVGDAQRQVNETSASVADLKKQIEELPKAIEAANVNAWRAREQAETHTLDSAEFHRLLQYAAGQERFSGDMAENLKKANAGYAPALSSAQSAQDNFRLIQENNAEIARLKEALVSLQNKLTVFDDGKKTMAHHDQVQGVLNAVDSKSGQTMEKMAAAIHLTQQQTVNIAERVLNHQETIQSVLARIHARQERQEQQLHAQTENHR